jgi:predicted TPR repeat methyltransferase
MGIFRFGRYHLMAFLAAFLAADGIVVFPVEQMEADGLFGGHRIVNQDRYRHE